MLQEIHSTISEENVQQFQDNGFYVREASIFNEAADLILPRLQYRLECVINGEYDLGQPPAKVNKIPQCFYCDGVFRFSPASSHAKRSSKLHKTIHLINVWQGDGLFKELVTSPALGNAVTKLMRWEQHGCRVAQDQVWIKPPHSGPLSYHRDTPYIDFSPKEVCTVWIPLAELSENCGTLEYCRGSQHWRGTKRRGSANQFYDANYRALLLSAAQEEAENRRAHIKKNDESSSDRSYLPPLEDIETVVSQLVHPTNVHVVRFALGGCAFHNGNTWHGSGPNTTEGWRCGIGIHFVRGNSELEMDIGPLWKQLQGDGHGTVPREDVFPRTA